MRAFQGGGRTLILRYLMSMCCVPSLILKTGNITVNKRSQSFAPVEFTLGNGILKGHAFRNVKTRLEAQRPVKKLQDNPALWLSPLYRFFKIASTLIISQN